MNIRYGFDIEIDLPCATTIITAFDVHPERRTDILEDSVDLMPTNYMESYTDYFGNACRRVGPGSATFHAKGVIALGSRSVHMATRRGPPIWHIMYGN